MRTELTTKVAAPSPVVYRLVGEVDAWPGLFPHVQSVASVGVDAYHLRVTWRSIVFSSVCHREADESSGRIVFQGVGGITRGCRCVWTIDQIDESRTHVRLSIERSSRFAFIDQLLLRLLFRDLARQTVAMVILLAEADAAAHALA